MTKPQPHSKMYDNANAVYTAFSSKSDPETKSWTGNSVSEFLAEQTKVPKGSFGQLMRKLERIGCIEYTRGAINRQAIVRCIMAPTPELWKSHASRLTKPTTFGSLIRQLQQLQTQIGHTDVSTALFDHEQRLKAIEQELEESKRAEKA